MRKKVSKLLLMLLMKVWRAKKKKGAVAAETSEVQEGFESVAPPFIVPPEKLSEKTIEKPSEKKLDTICLTERVNAFLCEHYDFRYNLLTEETEFRPLNESGQPSGILVHQRAGTRNSATQRPFLSCLPGRGRVQLLFPCRFARRGMLASAGNGDL